MKEIEYYKSFGLVYISLRKKSKMLIWKCFKHETFFFFSGILKEPFPPRKLNVVVKPNSHYLFWIYDIA